MKLTRHEIESKFVYIDENDSTHDSLLNIQNSKIIKTRNRSKKASNKLKSINRERATKRQRVFENFTRRESFDFEYNKIIDLTFDVQISFNQFSCTLYSKFTFQSFSMISYFRFSFKFQSFFEFSLFAQLFRFSQIYNQSFETQSNLISLTTKKKKRKNDDDDDDDESEISKKNTKRVRK